MLDGRHRCAGWQCHSARPPMPTAGRCLLRWRHSHPYRVSSRSSTINLAPGAAPARHQVPSSAMLKGSGWLTSPRSFPNDADHRAGPAGLPHPATRASLPDTGAWTIARNCQISQVYTPTALCSPPSVSC